MVSEVASGSSGPGTIPKANVLHSSLRHCTLTAPFPRYTGKYAGY